jgi:uncharacterized paraquat-inducible protein A
LKEKRTKKSVWFKYAEEKGIDPHKSAWSDFSRNNTKSNDKNQKLASLRFCTQCGAQFTSDSRFCERCGNRTK